MGLIKQPILGSISLKKITETIIFTSILGLLLRTVTVIFDSDKASILLSSSPASAQSMNPSRSLGTVNVLSGPYACDSDNCYDLEVNCPTLAESGEATLKVSEPLTTTEKGTISFFTGWWGTWFWEDNGPEASRVLNELRVAGYRTAQVKWDTNWWQGATNQQEGYAKLACKPATIMNWVNTNLNNMNNAFCATGHSNGASEIGYSLSQYGLANQLDAVLFDAGPNYARLDHACIQDDPLYQDLWYPSGGRGDVDDSFGYLILEDGPCFQQNTNFRTMFQDASVSYGSWQYYYPTTSIGFVFGDQDNSSTKDHGLFHYNHLLQSGTPYLSITNLPFTGHGTTGTPEGGDAIRDFMLDECYVKSPTAMTLQAFNAEVSSNKLTWEWISLERDEFLHYSVYILEAMEESYYIR